MDDKTLSYQVEILKAIRDAGGPVGSTRIVEALAAVGLHANDRTVRFHLKRLDEAGLTSKVSRRMGREITARGLRELESASLVQRMRFIVTKIDAMCFDMSFDLNKGAGNVVLNFSLIRAGDVERALDEIEAAFAAGLGMGRLALARGPGQRIGAFSVPPDHVGIGTVCNVTLNGVLLKMGIPVTSRYGSLLRMEGGRPVSFTEMVDYLGVTVDPLELFIRAGLTSVGAAARGQDGIVGASLREIPMNAGRSLDAIMKKLEALDLGGILSVGRPNRPLLNVPVDEGAIGLALVGGLNPVAAAHEAGAATTNTALHSLVDFRELDHYTGLRDHISRRL